MTTLSMDPYRELILDHYKHPRNFGRLKNPQLSVDHRNFSCGDVIHLELVLDHDQRITAVAFSSDGCALSRAGASLLTEHIKGKPLAEAQQLTVQDIMDFGGSTLNHSRWRCAVLALEALQKIY